MAPRIKYEKIIKQLKEVSKIDIETVYLAIPSEEECSECAIDPISGMSINQFCPSCNGAGHIKSLEYKGINANVEYSSGTEMLYAIAGMLKKDQIGLTIIVDELEDIGIDPEDFFLENLPVDHFRIGRGKYRVERVTPGKLQGILYEIEVVLEPIKG